MSNKQNSPVPPATCPECFTPLNRFRIALMSGRNPRIRCNHCGTQLRPNPVMYRLWSIISFILFFAFLLIIIRVAKFLIILRVVLILGLGILMLAFSSSFMLFEKAES